MRCTLLLPLACLVLSVPIRADSPPGEVEELVARLGSSKFKEREAAAAALDRCGAAALPALQAAVRHPDPEVSYRAQVLVQRIEQRLETAQLLGGKKLRLTYKDVAILDAVSDFSAKAGVAIEVEGDRLGLRDRTISVDTGDVPFWEAFDLFCRQAGLRERPAPMIPAGPGNPHGKPRIVINEGYNSPPPVKQPARIALEDAKSVPLPTAYCGAVRLRAVVPQAHSGKPVVSKYPPVETPAAVGFVLDVRPEPGLMWHGVASLRITRAVDEHDQVLVQPEPFVADRMVDPLLGNEGPIVIWDGSGLPLALPPSPRYALARLKPGKQPARTLKEVGGTLTVELMALRKLMTVNDVLSASSKEFTAGDGTILKILDAKEQKQHLVVRVQVSGGQSTAAVGNVVRVVKGNNGVLLIDSSMSAPRMDGGFALVDGTGKSYSAAASEHFAVENGNGGLGVEYVLKFARADVKGAPVSLIFSAPRLRSIDIPFTLRDVPLVDNPQLPPASGDGLGPALLAW
jgi:hypothetical protein